MIFQVCYLDNGLSYWVTDLAIRFLDHENLTNAVKWKFRKLSRYVFTFKISRLPVFNNCILFIAPESQGVFITPVPTARWTIGTVGLRARVIRIFYVLSQSDKNHLLCSEWSRCSNIQKNFYMTHPWRTVPACSDV